MKIGFLIITYGENYLYDCINSINLFYPDFSIYIVDNNINSNVNIDKLNKNITNIFYTKNIGNYYELGSIWFAVKTWPKIDKFIIIHNSMILIERFPIDIEKCQFLSFWKTIASDYSPALNFVEKNIDNYTYDKIWFSVTGCCCVIDTKILKDLINLGYDKIYATNKFEAVGTEILFGYLITNILNIENNSLFDKPLEHYISGNEKYKYIKKQASGQGVNNITQPTYILNNYNIFNKLIDIKFNNVNNKNECYVALINVIDTPENIEIQNFLLNTEPSSSLLFYNIKFSIDIICSIRHRLFTKKYFPTYYQYEKEMILNGYKKIFN